MKAWLQHNQARFAPYADPLLGVIFTTMGIIALATASPDETTVRDADAVAYALAIAMAAPLAVRRRWPVPVLGIFMAGLVVYNGRSYPEVNVDFFGPIIGLYTVASSQTRRVSITATVLAAVCVGIGNLLDAAGSESLGDWLVAVVFITGTWAIGDSVRRRRIYHAALETRTRELEEARHDLARQAVNEERLRMARELHDVVAHTLTAIVVQTAVARLRLAQNPESAPETLDAIESLSRGALEELRSILSVLRSEDGEIAQLAPTARLEDVEQLARQLEASGIAVIVKKQGDLSSLPPVVELAAYRIVQEALTNVVKHAPGARVHVSLAETPEGLSIEVRDNGNVRAVAQRIAGSGRGLAGMQERAALLGGTFEAGPAPDGGFRVAATLPAGENP